MHWQRHQMAYLLLAGLATPLVISVHTVVSFDFAMSIIPGWQEVLQLMRPGDKWSIVLPSELGYGERGAGQSIGPNEVLLFDIELMEVRVSGN